MLAKIAAADYARLTECPNSASAHAPRDLSQKPQNSVNIAYLRSSDELPCPSNASRLYSPRAIETQIPGSLDQILKLENTWKSSGEILVALSFSSLDERYLKV